ncbi:MAG: DUF2341 domain-containing protein [Verrucomicrobia bacterium]|nr:DUF2341 domain-containing protein [Verrucomicrobiota bacterium]
MTKLTFFLLSLALGSAAVAQDNTAKALEQARSELHRAVREGKVAGAAHLVVRDGKTIYSEAAGLSDIDGRIPFKIDSLLRIYSMSKPIVSVGAMKLCEQGRFKLDDPVALYIPGFSNATVLQKIGDKMERVAPNRPITVRDVLRHTTGYSYGDEAEVREYYLGEGLRYWGPGDMFPPKMSIAKAAEALARIPALHHPGEKFTYGYSTDLLGRLIEVWSGKPLDVFLRESVLAPLEMEDTGFSVRPETRALFSTCVTVRDGKFAVLDPAASSPFNDGFEFLSGGGGLVSTVPDYANFCQMLVDGGQFKGRRLLTPETLKLMFTDQLTGVGGSFKFGLGFGIEEIKLGSGEAQRKAMQYSWGGYASTEFRIVPAERFIQIFALQQIPYTQDLAKKQIAVVYEGLPAPAPAKPTGKAGAYEGWRHSGVLMILTTPEGANLPESAEVEGFPLLVRLHKDWFDFTQVKSNGEDIRFSTSTGAPLSFQIEEWDPAKGEASIWVRIPTIKGNERQELRLHWGHPDAISESSGSAVFNESNGYLSVWHMNVPVKDEVGTLESKDVGTTATTGMIGEARHLAGSQGIFGGEMIPNYPVGASPHSSEMWLRAEKSNGRALAWGNEHGQGKVVMHFQSPPHVKMECYFSGADVSTAGRLPMNEWIYVVHTYQQGDSRVYVNGELSGVSAKPNAPLAIKSPARLWIGGWYHNYDFIGGIDEVRVSKVARSADWVKLQHENQKAQQTLVGLVVMPGATFAVSPAPATVPEGKSATFTAQAGGAQKVYWSLVRDGHVTVVAIDRFTFQFDAGRVTGDDFATLRFQAVYANEVRTQDIGITIKEDIAEPVFALKAPAKWDGRETIEVVPQINNLEAMQAMQAKGAGELKTEWSAGPFAVIKEVAPGKLILTRAQNSGTLTVTATLSNGGKPVTQSVTIDVKEPTRDAWVARMPAKDEMPEDGQFYARDDRSEGTIHCNGTLTEAADEVFLRLYADDRLIGTETAKPRADGAYALASKLKPGLIKYRVEFGTKTGGRETVRHTATNLVCGDAYIIDGQSNALATDTGEQSPPETHEWIRSYGRMLWRVQQAKLTHGIRGILWHQGENDQGADGPTGGFGWETYHPFFIEMAAGWKQDFPNVQHYYVFQIWPNSCAMGGREGAGDRLREKQRTLPQLFANMSILSTLGIRPPGGCHFPLTGWAEFARLIQPVIERDHYGKVPAASVTAPNLRRASYAGSAKDTISLEFDQPVVWTDTLAAQFYLDGEKDPVASGSVTGNVLTLKLKEASAATMITYLKEIAWNQDTLLNGANGLAALTFCDVPIQPAKSAR